MKSKHRKREQKMSAKHKQATKQTLRERKEKKAAKAEERHKRQAVMAAKHSKQPTAQRQITKNARIDVNTSCSAAVMKQSGARQLKRSGSKDAPKANCTMKRSMCDLFSNLQ